MSLFIFRSMYELVAEQGIRKGDFIKIDWEKRKNEPPWLGYAPFGTVEQITKRLLILRSVAGYSFTVSVNDLASGVYVRKANKEMQKAC